MAPPRANEKTIAYRRTHNLLLGTRLLSQRGTPSPFTLILDSLNQSSAPLVEEYIARAKAARINVTYVSFVTLRPPKDVNKIIKARGKPLEALQKEILSSAPTEKPSEGAKTGVQNLLIIDSMNYICASSLREANKAGRANLTAFLSSLLSPTITLLATYHMDVPRISHVHQTLDYSPEPFELLKYLCTTLITVYPPSHIFAQKRALDRSLPLPSFGLNEGVEGCLTSLGANTGWCDTCGSKAKSKALIFELEHRRMSGRAMTEWFFMACHPNKKTKERLSLLEDHPDYNPTIFLPSTQTQEGIDDDGLTFSLGLTAKQKQDREGIILPYFDAQTEEGGTGGRILYVPGREDDWDEEEDEI